MRSDFRDETSHVAVFIIIIIIIIYILCYLLHKLCSVHNNNNLRNYLLLCYLLHKLCSVRNNNNNDNNLKNYLLLCHCSCSREISVLLGNTWQKMKMEERKMYAVEARLLAEQYKKLNPDCWKRKRAASWVC